MKRRLSIVVPIIVTSTWLLTGCGIGNAITPPVVAGIYATPADAAGAPSAVALPAWVPAEASLIRIKTNTAKNASILTFTVPAVAPIGEACSAEMSSNLPQLNESWWPQLLPTENITCTGNWHLFAVGTQFYAWSP